MLRQNDTGWANPKVLTILAIIFLCGAAVGSTVTRSYLHSKMFPQRQHQRLDEAQRVGLTRLKTELNLSADQEKVVTEVLDDYAKYYQNIEDEREDVAEHGERRILDILTPAQQKKFSQIFGRPSR
jgi:vacuolar-type H+-ATPase subunit H